MKESRKGFPLSLPRISCCKQADPLACPSRCLFSGEKEVLPWKSGHTCFSPHQCSQGCKGRSGCRSQAPAGEIARPSRSSRTTALHLHGGQGHPEPWGSLHPYYITSLTFLSALTKYPTQTTLGRGLFFSFLYFCLTV